MNPLIPAAQSVLAGLALVILGVLGVCLIFHAIPADNKEALTFLLGAISGALTVAGGQKVVAALTQTPPAQPGPQSQPENLP
jgi:hypothetical protein